MTFQNLTRLINKAVKSKPPKALTELCGEYYQPYYHLMYLLAGQLEKGFCVELGAHVGRGLGSMAMSGKDNLVIGLDTVLWPDLDKVLAAYPNALFFQKPSLPIPIDITRLHRPIDLLFLDTEHSHAMVKAEFEAYQPWLAKGAVVLFDDLHAQGDGPLGYFESLPYEKIQDDRLHPVCGYGVVIYE